MSEKPIEPTAQEQADFEAWKLRYEAALEEGDNQGWLEYEGYDGAPSAYSPDRGYERALQRWKDEEREISRVKDERRKAEIHARADQAAKDARKRVLKEL